MNLNRPVKHPNFVLFVIFFLAIILWIAVFLQHYFTNQGEPPLPPSAIDNKKR